MNTTALQTAAVLGFGYCMVLGTLSHVTSRIPWPCRGEVKYFEAFNKEMFLECESIT